LNCPRKSQKRGVMTFGFMFSFSPTWRIKHTESIKIYPHMQQLPFTNKLRMFDLFSDIIFALKLQHQKRIFIFAFNLRLGRKIIFQATGAFYIFAPRPSE